MGEVLVSGKQRGLWDAGNRKKTSGVCFCVVWDFRTLDSYCFLPAGLKKPTPPNCKDWRVFYGSPTLRELHHILCKSWLPNLFFFSPPWCYFCADRLWNVCSCSPLYIRFRSSPPRRSSISLYTVNTEIDRTTAAIVAPTQSTLK